MTSSVPLVAGKHFQAQLDAVAKSAPFLLAFGISNKTWSGVPLPLALGPMGWAGCVLNISYDEVFPLLSGGDGRLSLPVKAGSLPAGARLYAQIITPESTGSRIATSRGFELTMQKSVFPFSIVAIPDTQNYVRAASWARNFDAMTQWIVNQRVARNIGFVSHVGDIVNDGAAGANNNKAQWDYAHTAMRRFDGVLPYGAAVGNRDFDTVDDKSKYIQFLSRFGASRYSGRSWFKGSGPNGLNMHQIFKVNGQSYLHVMLEWRPRDVAIEWARQVLTANAGLPTILTTHQYLGYGQNPFDDHGDTSNGTGDNGGTSVRHKLVEPFPQIFLVLCGHNPGGTHRQVSTILGTAVVEQLFDYSFDPNGGNGWMNVLECQPDRGKLVSSCVSPTYVPGTSIGLDRRATTENNVTYPFDFHLHRRLLETTTAVRFTDGFDFGPGIYNGATDTFVDERSPAAASGAVTTIAVVDSSADRVGLLKFGGLFGTGSGQVPRNKHIARAILTLTTEGTNAPTTDTVNLHRLKVGFRETSTWNSLGGIKIGTTVETLPDATTTGLLARPGTRSFDVTRSLRAWQQGQANHGWALLGLGPDEWAFRSREWTAAAERPMLTVIYEK